jgi:hypothetical protein
MLTLPFVTVNAFKAHPTFLDLLNLRSGDSSLADQTEQLNEILLEASNWADNVCEQPLEAHVATDNRRIRVDRYGRIIHKPFNIPVVSVTSISVGTYPNSLSALSTATIWIEDAREIIAYAQPLALTSNVGPLQFGTLSQGVEQYTQWTYVAGYANTLLASTVTSGVSSIPVQDATGIVAGQTLRIMDPGSREAVTVASSYVPATGATSVPLVSPTQFAHNVTSGPIGVSALPPDVHLAVIMYSVAILLRRSDTPANTAFPGSLSKPSINGGRTNNGENLVAEAEAILAPYKRVR